MPLHSLTVESTSRLRSCVAQLFPLTVTAYDRSVARWQPQGSPVTCEGRSVPLRWQA